jgi:protein-disulfide isomerase
MTALVVAAGSTPVAAQSAGSSLDPTIAAADRGRITGSEKATTWLLVVSDFQCPFCKQWHDQTWEAIRKEYVATGKIRVAFLNYPLSIHPNARPAALYAMCASADGKFWQVADRLFATQNAWKDLRDPGPYFDGIVRAAGLNVEKIHACTTGPAIASMVDADQRRMTRAGTMSTPTFYIGQGKIEGAVPLAEFRQALDAALRGARKP